MGYVTVVDIQIDAVQPASAGFVLQGRGLDRAEYKLEMSLDIPLDRRTQTVLGEMLAQSEWRILRRATPRLGRASRRLRDPVS